MKFGKRSVDFLKSTEFGGKLRNSEAVKTLVSSVKCGNIIIFPTNHQVDFCLIKLNAWPLSLFVNLREKKGNFEGKVPLPVFCTSFSIVVLCTAAAKLRLRIRTGVKPRCR